MALDVERPTPTLISAGRMGGTDTRRGVADVKLDPELDDAPLPRTKPPGGGAGPSR